MDKRADGTQVGGVQRRIVAAMTDAESHQHAERELAGHVASLRDAGVRRVHVLAWRDLDDPDAGGSEVHADECETRWAAAGLEIQHRTSSATGHPPTAQRSGYRVVRSGNRYSVFPRAVAAELFDRTHRFDALIEVMNGVPFLSPIWCRRPRMLFLHHVHGPMWDQIMPGPFAAAGRALETHLAPPVYRRGLTATPSEATREELIEIGFRPELISAIPNGTDPRFTPGGTKTPQPSIVAVARLAPVKRFGLLIDSVAAARERVPDATLTIVGDGPDRNTLEARVRELGAENWVTFTGHVAQPDLVELYRSSWIVASASLAEGWGLSLTEAGGCATPAVATDIRGHRSSVVDGVTGVLASEAELGDAIARVLTDHDLRERLGGAAAERVRTMTWDATAAGVLGVLVKSVERSRSTK